MSTYQENEQLRILKLFFENVKELAGNAAKAIDDINTDNQEHITEEQGMIAANFLVAVANSVVVCAKSLDNPDNIDLN